MAEQKPKSATKKPKRKLRAAPTLREQAAQSTAKSNTVKKSKLKTVFGSKVFAPFRAIGRLFRKIWGVKILRPIRFVARMIGYVLVPVYFRNSFKELKLVTWPNFKTTWRLTFAVILFGTLFGLAIAGIDVILEKGFREVLLG